MAFDPRDHIGVSVHTNAPAYTGQLPQLAGLLNYLGVKWVRDDNPSGPSLLPGFNVQYVNTATDQTTAVANTNTALAAGAKAIELINEPPAVPIMYGSSVQGVGGDLPTHNTRYGHIPVWRYFASGMPGALPAGNDVSQVGIYSMKCNGSDFTGMVNGTFDAAIRTWAGTLPAGQTIYACYFHEPENNWPSGASFAAGQVHFINLIRDIVAKGQTKANLKTITIFTAYILSFGHTPPNGGHSSRNIVDWWPSVNPDMVGFDFDDNNAARTSFFDWAAYGYCGWAKAWADSKGIPWSVTECGSIRTTGDTSHAQYVIDMGRQLDAYAANGASYITYWDDSSATLSTANEIAMYKSYVTKSAAMVTAQSTNRAIVSTVAGRVPVIGSALAPPADPKTALLWGKQPNLTAGNLHLFRGNRIDADWATWRAAAYATLPLVGPATYQVSATGYHDYTPASDDTTDAVAATQIVPDFQQLISDGADKVYLYEAVDESTSFPTSSKGFYGLATPDWTPKPQGNALAAYIASFVTGPTVPPAPTSVIAMAGDQDASVTWQVPTSSSPADNYTITMAPADQPPLTVIAPLQHAVFAGLRNGVGYTFAVHGNNAQGSSADTVSNLVTPVGVPVPPPGPPPGPGPGPGPLRTPFPGPYPAPLTVTNAVAGQVQQLFLYDPVSSDLLNIVPFQSGIRLNDFDLGYPAVRDVTSSNPGRDGEYDQTRYFGARSPSLSLTVIDAPDVTGTMQPAGYWKAVLEAWLGDPGNLFRLGYQIAGQQQRFMNVRVSSSTAPFVGSGAGRAAVSMQLALRSPDGLQYESNPLPNDLAVLVNGLLVGDGRYETILPQAVSGSGLTFPVSFPVSFPTQSSGTIAVPYRGSARCSPEIRIVGICTDPSITALNPDGTSRGKLAFTGLTMAGTDEVRIDLATKQVIRISSGSIVSNIRQLMTTWGWFDLLPDTSMNRLKFEVGSGTAVAKCYFYNCFA